MKSNENNRTIGTTIINLAMEIFRFTQSSIENAVKDVIRPSQPRTGINLGSERS